MTDYQSMNNAQLLLDRIKQQAEDAQALQQYWLSLFPEFGDISARQVRVWTTMYSFDEVIFGLEKALVQLNKRTQAWEEGGDPATVQPMVKLDLIKYASGVMARRKGQAE